MNRQISFKDLEQADHFSSYVDPILAGLPIRSSIKSGIADELKADLEDHLYVLLDEGAYLSSALEEVRENFGCPNALRDEILQNEADENCLRDPVCLMAMVAGLVAFFGLAASAKAIFFGAGLTASANPWILIVYAAIACAVGFGAFELNRRMGGNVYRDQEFVFLPIMLLLFATAFQFDLYFVGSASSGMGHAFAGVHLPWVNLEAKTLTIQTFILDYDFSGVPAWCNKSVPFASLNMPITWPGVVGFMILFIGLWHGLEAGITRWQERFLPEE